MPLFFIISGFLAKEYRNTIKQEFLKICRRLLLPYFILIFLGWGLEWLLIGNECSWGGELLHLEMVGIKLLSEYPLVV